VGGLLPPTTRGTGDVRPKTNWVVRPGGFSFQIKSPFAIGNASVEQGKSSPSVSEPDQIFALPMQLQSNDPLTSIMTVTIKQPDSCDNSDPWIVSEVTGKVPTSIWGLCKFRIPNNSKKSNSVADLATQDPTKNSNQILDLLDPSGSTVTLMMGINVS
jgi:hypothetical protein